MNDIAQLLIQTAVQVGDTLAANWPFLVGSALITGLLQVYVDQHKVAGFLQRHRTSGVAAATAAAVTTPLCSCGTTAVVLGMMAGMMPWAPVIAFMVASPLTSPQELLLSAGLFGWPFAIAFFTASIVLGLFGGLLAHLLESRGWLADQARFRPAAQPGSAPPAATAAPARRFWRETAVAARRLLLFFLGFAFIGYLLNNLIPPGWVATLFGEGQAHGVALAALFGIPFYFNTEASLPLARALLDGGMSSGAVLAFLITGAGTSVGAIAGAATIARWRVLALIIATLLIGATAFGYAYNALLAVGAF
jgi:uncharacterized protein